MKAILEKIEVSFKKAMKGEESLTVVIWWWGVLAYIFSFVIADKLILAINLRSVDIIISGLMVVYFIWHFYVLKKCSPKKPQLSKEEKQHLKEEARRNFGKKFLRKLFLQEPLTKWDPVFVTMVIDLFCMAHFVGYIFR